MFNQLVKNYGWHELVTAEVTLRSSINAHTRHGFVNPDVAAKWMDNYRLVVAQINQRGIPGPPPATHLPNLISTAV